MARSFLILIAALCCFSLAALAQTPAPDKKADAGKGKDGDAGKGKAKDAPKGKGDEPAKEIVKPKVPLEKWPTPDGSILVVVEDLAKAMELIPKGFLLSPEAYQTLLQKIKTQDRQLKSDRKLPSSCKLQCKLDGDFLAINAEFTFSTEQPNMTVFLGLRGAHLMEEGKLDRQTAVLDSTDKGFIVLAEKEGNHQLTLSLRARVKEVDPSAATEPLAGGTAAADGKSGKKPTPGGSERGVVLDLPGAAVTTCQLELPTKIKELRCNDDLVKAKPAGRWLLGLDKSKTLSLSWKEPIDVSGNAPLARVETTINVDIDAADVNVNAELMLEDKRYQTRDWYLLVPSQAAVDLKALSGLAHTLIPPDAKTPYYTLRLQETTAERLRVKVSMRLPRPGPGVLMPIGPFTVLGAYQQQGTIVVRMPMEASLGQRLAFHRRPDVTQIKNSETEAAFQYVVAAADKGPKAGPAPKVPLELEWRHEKNHVETRVEQGVKIKTVQFGWEVETTTLIKTKALQASISAIDVNLAQPRARGLFLLGSAMPGLGFPAALPWGGFWNRHGMPWGEGHLDESAVSEVHGKPLQLIPQDPFGKVRVVLKDGPAKEFVLKIQNRFRLPASVHGLHLELPRPLNTQDRGANIAIQSDERLELRYGPGGADEPVPDKHHFEWTLDQCPAAIDFAWSPYKRESVADIEIDVTLHPHTAQVRQTIRFPLEPSGDVGADPKRAQVELHVPRAVDKITVASGGEITNRLPARQALWVRPTATGAAKVELVLEYDLAIAAKTEEGAQRLNVPFAWPAGVSRKDVKVRVWSQAGGVNVGLPDELLSRGLWKERSIEAVAGKHSFPLLVLQGAAAQLPLALRIEESTATALTPLLAERGLVQVVMTDDGAQLCRTRLLIRKLNTRTLAVELPFPMPRFRERPTFFMGKYRINDWKTDKTEKIVYLHVNPELQPLPAILEISYALPADALERNQAWRTVLYPPQFPGAVIGPMRWELSLPAPMIAAAPFRQARVETQWSVQNWLLTPEPSVSGAELEMWLTGKEPAQAAPPVTFAFAGADMQPHVIYHLSRQSWLLGCSGLFLVVTLGVYLSPLPRLAFWLVLLGLGMGAVAVGMLWPSLLPPVLFGMQPGVVLLFLFVGGHWYWQDRYRRQLVFLPAFSRNKPSSTMVRNNVPARPREASTVDAPAVQEAGGIS